MRRGRLFPGRPTFLAVITALALVRALRRTGLLSFWPCGTQGCFRSSRVTHKAIWILAMWHTRTLLVALWRTRPIRNGPWVPHGHYALGHVPHSRKRRWARASEGAGRMLGPGAAGGKRAWAGCCGREAGSSRVSRAGSGLGPDAARAESRLARCRMGGNGAGPDSACAVRARESG